MNWDEMFAAGAPQPLMPGQQPAPRQPAPGGDAIVVRGPDGTENRFPVGTPQEAILRAMQQRYATPQAVAQPQSFNQPGDVHQERPLPGEAPVQQGMRDFLPSLGTGIVQGAYELATLPATGLRLATQGANVVSGWLGADPLFPDNGLMQPVFDAQDQGREWMADTLHQPTTTAGEFARTVGEFLPGAAALGPGQFVGNTVRYGVVPGVLSEAAGQMTEGTALEPWARAAAGLIGVGAGAIQASAGAGAGIPGSTGVALGVLARNLRGSNITEAEIAAAEALIQRGQTYGVTVTWPEALYTTTNGRVDATALQRVVEQSRGGQPVMADVMANRTTAARAAGDAAMPELGPAASPAALGQLTQELADDAIRYVRDQINDATRQLYRQSEGVQIDPIVFGRLYNDPLVQSAIREIRSSPVYGRTVANLPDDSVAMMDALKQFFNDMAAKQAGERANFAAGVYGGQERAVRDAATDASPEYAQALAEQSMMRRQWLDPLERGQMGALQGTADLGTQTGTLFPRNPFAGTAEETADTVSRLAAADPDAASALVRSYVEQQFNEATRDLVRGGNQFGPAKFVAAIRGNAEQARTLEAAVRALPDGDARWEGFESLLRVFQATGARQPAGSGTTFNTALEAQLSGSGTPMGTLGSLIASPTESFKVVRGWWNDRRLGGNAAELARIITDPASGPMLMRLAMGGPLRDLASVAATLLQQGTVAYTGGQQFDNPRLGALVPSLGAP